jgi:sec-independent protein translocase protein TatC
MAKKSETPDGTMSLLSHLDELRSRLLRILVVYVVFLAACWTVSNFIVPFLLKPIRQHLFEGEDIVFINITEPFMIYMKASALAALFIASPYILHQIWAFVAPGLYRRERRLAIPFLVFGSLFFAAGGAFGYYVATPVAASWLIGLGEKFTANITLRSAFSFQSRVIIGMGVVFELPIVIFFLSRIGVVTPRFLMKHFRSAVLVIALLAAIITPTGDILTMSVFAGPMILLYLLGVAISWLTGKRRNSPEER